MTAATSDLQRFAASVQRTQAALAQLESVLAAEQIALTGADPQALEQAVRQKLAALAELEPLVAERDSIQQRLGAAPGIPGGDQLMSQAPADAAIRKHWDALTATAKRIERLNTQNAQLASQGEKTAQHALSILTGRPSEPDLYGRRGQTPKRIGGVTLAKA